MENYAGCYGSNQFDRHFESMLDAQLDRLEDEKPFDYDDYEAEQHCSHCGSRFEISEYEEQDIYIESVNEHWVYCMHCDEDTQLKLK